MALEQLKAGARIPSWKTAVEELEEFNFFPPRFGDKKTILSNKAVDIISTKNDNMLLLVQIIVARHEQCFKNKFLTLTKKIKVLNGW